MTNHPTPNNAANPNYVPPAKEKLQTTSSNQDKKTADVSAQGNDLPRGFFSWRHHRIWGPSIKSTVLETSHDPGRRRLLIDDQTLVVPTGAFVETEVRADGSGEVTVRFKTSRLQIIDADNRIAKKRSRRNKK